jgi:hypothetical protein
MNVLDLDVYMDVLYIVCRFCISSCAGYIVFCKKNCPGKLTMAGWAIVDKLRLTYNGWLGHHR